MDRQANYIMIKTKLHRNVGGSNRKEVAQHEGMGSVSEKMGGKESGEIDNIPRG